MKLLVECDMMELLKKKNIGVYICKFCWYRMVENMCLAFGQFKNCFNYKEIYILGVVWTETQCVLNVCVKYSDVVKNQVCVFTYCGCQEIEKLIYSMSNLIGKWVKIDWTTGVATEMFTGKKKCHLILTNVLIIILLVLLNAVACVFGKPR